MADPVPDNYLIKPYGDTFIPYFRQVMGVAKEITLPDGSEYVTEAEANSIIDQIMQDRKGTSAQRIQQNRNLYIRDIPMQMQQDVGFYDPYSTGFYEEFDKVLGDAINNKSAEIDGKIEDTKIEIGLLELQRNDPGLSWSDKTDLNRQIKETDNELKTLMLVASVAHNVQAVCYMPQLFLNSAEDAISIGFSNKYQADTLTRLYNTNEAWQSAITQRLFGGMVQAAKADPLQFGLDMVVGILASKGVAKAAGKITPKVFPKTEIKTLADGQVKVTTRSWSVTDFKESIVDKVKEKLQITTKDPVKLNTQFDQIKKYYDNANTILSYYAKPAWLRSPVQMDYNPRSGRAPTEREMEFMTLIADQLTKTGVSTEIAIRNPVQSLKQIKASLYHDPAALSKIVYVAHQKLGAALGLSIWNQLEKMPESENLRVKQQIVDKIIDTGIPVSDLPPTAIARIFNQENLITGRDETFVKNMDFLKRGGELSPEFYDLNDLSRIPLDVALSPKSSNQIADLIPRIRQKLNIEERIELVKRLQDLKAQNKDMVISPYHIDWVLYGFGVLELPEIRDKFNKEIVRLGPMAAINLKYFSYEESPDFIKNSNLNSQDRKKQFLVEAKSESAMRSNARFEPDENGNIIDTSVQFSSIDVGSTSLGYIPVNYGNIIKEYIETNIWEPNLKLTNYNEAAVKRLAELQQKRTEYTDLSMNEILELTDNTKNLMPKNSAEYREFLDRKAGYIGPNTLNAMETADYSPINNIELEKLIYGPKWADYATSEISMDAQSHGKSGNEGLRMARTLSADGVTQRDRGAFNLNRRTRAISSYPADALRLNNNKVSTFLTSSQGIYEGERMIWESGSMITRAKQDAKDLAIGRGAISIDQSTGLPLTETQRLKKLADATAWIQKFNSVWYNEKIVETSLGPVKTYPDRPSYIEYLVESGKSYLPGAEMPPNPFAQGYDFNVFGAGQKYLGKSNVGYKKLNYLKEVLKASDGVANSDPWIYEQLLNMGLAEGGPATGIDKTFLKTRALFDPVAKRWDQSGQAPLDPRNRIWKKTERARKEALTRLEVGARDVDGVLLDRGGIEWTESIQNLEYQETKQLYDNPGSMPTAEELLDTGEYNMDKNIDDLFSGNDPWNSLVARKTKYQVPSTFTRIPTDFNQDLQNNGFFEQFKGFISNAMQFAQIKENTLKTDQQDAITVMKTQDKSHTSAWDLQSNIVNNYLESLNRNQQAAVNASTETPPMDAIFETNISSTPQGNSKLFGIPLLAKTAQVTETVEGKKGTASQETLVAEQVANLALPLVIKNLGLLARKYVT